jgi:hypothetical protein
MRNLLSSCSLALPLCALASLALPLGGCPGSDPPVDDTTTGPGSSGAGSSGSGSTSEGSGGSSGTETTAGPSTSDDGTPDTTDGETGEPVVLDGPCELADKVGAFSLLREDIYTTFNGAVADGVVPGSVLENVGDESGCRLLRRNNPFCDPPCGPSETCDFDGACVPYPLNHDVGLVTIDGLLQPVMVEPSVPTYEYFDTDLDHPAWEPAAAIELQAAGGDYEAFTLHGDGVEMIEPATDELVLDPGQALTVEWVPDDGPGTVRVELNIDQHGLTPVELWCTSEDTGSLEVPAQFIAEFVQFGVTGYPSVSYYRETVDSVQITPGCVEFGVRAHRNGTLTVIGHTPCSGPADCPEGLVCNMAIQTCE